MAALGGCEELVSPAHRAEGASLRLGRPRRGDRPTPHSGPAQGFGDRAPITVNARAAPGASL
eukprot:13711650-Alexandrium_andersonii.AAC.1